MKKVLLSLSLTTIGLLSFGQSNFDMNFLQQVFRTEKVEITKNDITKTLTDPAYWKLLGIDNAGKISKSAVNNVMYFSTPVARKVNVTPF